MLKRLLYKSVCAAFASGALVFAPKVYALPADAYASASRLAQGKWVKIRVSEDGMQFVSNETLKAMGFASPQSVNVYGYGGRRLPQELNASTPDDLPKQPVVRTDSGLVFFGTGTVNWYARGQNILHEQNPYSTGSYYFLSDIEVESEELTPYKTAYGSDDVRIETFTQMLLHESELSAPGDTGGDLMGEDFRSTSTRTFSFELPGAVNESVDYRVCFGAKAGGGSTVTYSVGTEQVGQSRIAGSTDVSTHISLQVTKLKGFQTSEGKGELTLKYEGSGVIYKANLDYIEASYERALRLDGGQLLFMYNVPAKENVVFSVSGIESGTLIWDVTDPVRPRAVDYDREGDKALFAPAGSGLRRYVAFNPSGVDITPASAGTQANQDIHSMELPQMVIISPKEFVSQAERIADMHRSKDGMVVHVLTPESIYNEFSSGAPDVTAYRRLLKMWYDRSVDLPEEEKFGYCLLFGRTTYDQRLLSDNLRGSSYPRVLSWQSRVDLSSSVAATINESTSYVSDNYIAMLDDTNSFSMSSGQLRVGVGRMPVKSVAEARAMTDKLLNYVEQPSLGAWRNNVMFLADDGDNAVHADQSQSVYARMLKNGGDAFLYERIYIDAYNYGSGSYKKTYPEAKSRLLKLLDEGVAVWQYIGHANPTSLTAEDLWTYTDLTSMTNRHMPLFYTASCEFIRFDADAVSGCETMWLTPNAGIIGAIAANRKVYISSNGPLSNAIGDNIFRRGSDGLPRRLGKVYADALNATGTEDNKHRFAVMGDPAMRVPVPYYNVRIDSFDGVDVSQIEDASDYPVVKGLSKVKVNGSIVGMDGQVVSDFNGTVVPTLYDAEIVVTTNGHVTDTKYPDGKEISYNDRKNRLFSGSFPVKDGKWEGTLLLPEEIENNYTQARLTVYAYSESGAEAHGATDRFYVYGWDEDVPEDNVDPEIVYMYLNNSAFRSGSTVGPEPVFKAKVRDESGINISSSGIGRLLTVIVDATKVYDNVADYYETDAGDPTTGTIAYPLSGLEEGSHTLDFIVWDNAGNSSRSSFEFVIASQESIPALDIFTDASPAVSSVTFYINSAEAQTGLVEVFDLSGRRVWHAEAMHNDGAFSKEWDLRDVGGARVPRGIYLYRATVSDASGQEIKATKKFAVGNP